MTLPIHPLHPTFRIPIPGDDGTERVESGKIVRRQDDVDGRGV